MKVKEARVKKEKHLMIPKLYRLVFVECVQPNSALEALGKAKMRDTYAVYCADISGNHSKREAWRLGVGADVAVV